EVGDEEIVPAVVVVVADAHALSPAGVREACLCCYVGESAIPIVAEEMRGRLGPSRKAFKPRTIYEKNVQPAVIVVVVEGHAASRGLQQIFVLVLAAEDSLRVQARLASDIQEGYAEIVAQSIRIFFVKIVFVRIGFL